MLSVMNQFDLIRYLTINKILHKAVDLCFYKSLDLLDLQVVIYLMYKTMTNKSIGL